MNLDRIAMFVRVARVTSFSAAARELGISPAAVSKQIMLLEDELGVKLLHRTTRLVTLTDAGQNFYLRATAALGELSEAVEAVGEQQNTPRGTLRVSVPAIFGNSYLLPVLSGFAAAYRDIVLDIAFDDRMVDPVAEGFDVVIRIGPMEDSSLMMKPLGISPLLLVASPAYLARAEEIMKPADLKQQQMIGFSQHGGAFEWTYQGRDGKQGHVRTECALRTNSASMMRAAAEQGLGIALLPKFALESTLTTGALVQVLPDYVTVPLRQVVALTPPTRHRTAKVQAFVEYLGKHLPKVG